MRKLGKLVPVTTESIEGLLVDPMQARLVTLDGSGSDSGYPEQDIGGPSLALATIYCREPRTVELTIADALSIGGL